jgi:type III restriction enzyme
MAKLEIEVAQNAGHARKLFTFAVGDDLYYKSNEMEQYKNGYVISDIEPLSGTVTFTGGTVIHQGEVIGDIVSRISAVSK